MYYTLPELPFEKDALEPHISAETVHYHYDKHHTGYVKKLENALKSETLRELTLEDLIRKSFTSKDASIFNPAAQVWNHNFYWNSLSPQSQDGPEGELLQAIERDFDSLDDFKKKFKEKAASEFGSGWAWLVYDDKTSSLRVISTTDAVTPIVTGMQPLLTLDVWEHAYYLDYKNERAAYIDAFLGNMINWEFASSLFEKQALAA